MSDDSLLAWLFALSMLVFGLAHQHKEVTTTPIDKNVTIVEKTTHG